MLEELTRKVDIGTVAVDVSNACRDCRLPGSIGLDRPDQVLDAWRAQLSRHAGFHIDRAQASLTAGSSSAK